MNQTNSTNKSGLMVLISVFFFWGFVAASNDILIPVFKEKLNLEQWQSQMISFAFYVAYTVGTIIYFIISKILKQDILNKIGYKNGIALGLLISATGTLLFIPAAHFESFPIMISGLFTVGLGFSLQQVAANPLTINLGDPKTGSQRLSMAGGVNNIGTTIGPLLIGYAIFGTIQFKNESSGFDTVLVPYLLLGLAFVIVAIIFKFSSIPNQLEVVQTNDVITADAHKKNALQYPQLWLGMIAIFVYVGVEVSTVGNLPEFMKQHLNISTDKVSPFVSLYWASLMIGRWTASVGSFNIKDGWKSALNFIMPYIAFAFFLAVNKIANNDITPFYVYALIIIGLIIANLLSQGNPARQLMIFSFAGIVSLLIGMFSTGMVSVYAFISVGLFCSTLWPCIYTLAIAGLGKHTNEGSSFLIMMIMGGGVISLVQGALSSDQYLGIQGSYIVGIVCFIYLAFYAWKASSILKANKIDF
jgi:MFS transporter, FHS family, L-fucose permease